MCFVKLRAGNDRVESQWVRNSRKTNRADILVGSVIDHLIRMK